MDLQLTLGDVTLATTLINSLLVVSGLVLFLLGCNVVIKRSDPTKTSTGLMAVLELFYTTLSDFSKKSIGEQGEKFVTFVVTAAFYLAVANLIGLLGLTPPTTDVNVTVALTVITLIYIAFSGMFTKGIWTYLKDTYLGDIRGFMLILFVPISIIGELSKIISLSFRLFGNIVSGALLLSLLTGLFAWLFTIWVPFGGALGGALSVSLLPILNAYFDVFAGLMQTFIFCTLTTMWIKAAVEARE